MTNWRYTLDIKPALRLYDERGFEASRDKVVGILRTSRDYVDGSGELYWLVAELEDAQNVSDFNNVLSAVYDWADDESVWLGLWL
jgi:hypothetical protein